MDASHYSHTKQASQSPGKKLGGKGSMGNSNQSLGSDLNNKKKKSPYLGTMDERDLRIIQLTQVNEQMKARVKQLTQALETSLLQRQQSHQLLI